eukprot:1313502-Alexandrium_andersonii.AAC.1
MSASLVGSEMCIRDRPSTAGVVASSWSPCLIPQMRWWELGAWCARVLRCLLYTSDAADDM